MTISAEGEVQSQDVQNRIVVLGPFEDQCACVNMKVAASPEGEPFIGNVTDKGVAKAQSIRPVVLEEPVQRFSYCLCQLYALSRKKRACN